MIYTFTLNPSVDCYIELPQKIFEDEVNRGKNELYRAGGKGLNVSRVLNLFGIENHAVFLQGGFTGEYIFDSFRNYDCIHLTAVKVQGINRINVKASYGLHSFVINGSGPCADEKTKDTLLHIAGTMKPDDTVVMAGSMMKGLDHAFLIQLAQTIHYQQARLIMDMELKDTELLYACQPHMIKPSLYELRLLLHDETITEKNLIHKVQPLLSHGIHEILVSQGPEGAVYIGVDKALKLEQPHDVLVNKSGAGDAMLAAWIASIHQGKTKEEALRISGAAGNAAASTTADITMNDIENFLDKMSVHLLGKC